MSSGSYLQTYVRCPFYMSDGRQHLYCEGPMDGVQTQLYFKTNAQMARYMKDFCCTHYGDCPYWKIIMSQKYHDYLEAYRRPDGCTEPMADTVGQEKVFV